MSNPIEYTVKVYPKGSKFWYLNGKLHREVGPAIEGVYGTMSWYLNGKPHREDGPAIEWANGTKSWYLHGELHREDGPAIKYVDGSKEWFLYDKKLTEAEFNARMNPVAKELTVGELGELEELLGYKIKIVKE
jgi:hypothetical protein